MKIANLFLVLSSAGLAAAAIYGSPAGADNNNELTRAEQACQQALDDGSEEALRKFLKLYPSSDTACYALASTQVLQDTGGASSSGANSSGSSSSSSGASSSSSGASSSSSGASSSSSGSSGLGNPGNAKAVGKAGESPGGNGMGPTGSRGRNG